MSLHKLKRFRKNKAKHEQYQREGRREKNKLRKLIKLSKKQPNNKQLASLIDKLS